MVKFDDRYGVEPHRLFAKEHLAQELLYHGKIGSLEGDPSYGHLRIVVIEYIEGRTLDQVKWLPSRLLHNIRRALEILHKKLGDLRGPNIMITKNKELRLIDFDWTGEGMESQYLLLMSPNLSWPEGVEALSIKEIDHDNEMLATLLQETD